IVVRQCRRHRNEPVPLTTAAALARLYGTSLDRLLASDDAVAHAGADVSGVLYRAAPPALDSSARGGLRVFEQYVHDYVKFPTSSTDHYPARARARYLRSPARPHATPPMRRGSFADT